MDAQTACLFVFDGFADWEPASVLAELRRTFGFSVQVVGLTRDPVKSMGGLNILPDLPIADAQPEFTNILILPGGDAWMRGEMKEVTAFISGCCGGGQASSGDLWGDALFGTCGTSRPPSSYE